MGAIKFNKANYYSITEGKICRSFKTPVEGSVSRVNQNGKTVHEVFYDALKGRITNITTKDGDYGKFWMITLEDEAGERDILQLHYSSGYSSSFLKTLPNVDLGHDVILAPKLEINTEGKKRGTLFVMQHGKALTRYYNQDHPNGIPDLEKKKVKGKWAYDDSEIMEFLENMVNEDILPQLKNAAKVQEPEEEEIPETEEEDKENFPF